MFKNFLLFIFVFLITVGCAPKTNSDGSLPEFKTGIEVETPQGCKDGKIRGVDC